MRTASLMRCSGRCGSGRRWRMRQAAARAAAESAKKIVDRPGGQEPVQSGVPGRLRRREGRGQGTRAASTASRSRSTGRRRPTRTRRSRPRPSSNSPAAARRASPSRAATPTPCTPAINKAVELGAVVMCFDSDAPRSKRLCYYGTDDITCGRTVMKELARVMGDKGTIAILAGNQTAPNLQKRVAGREGGAGEASRT